jgi:hypothetical protein
MNLLSPLLDSLNPIDFLLFSSLHSQVAILIDGHPIEMNNDQIVRGTMSFNQ